MTAAPPARPDTAAPSAPAPLGRAEERAADPVCAPVGAAEGVAAGPPFVMKKRRDFLAAAKGRRASLPGLMLQARPRAADEPSEAPVRVGYTCSKKVGNAVARNRAKRRLRAAAAQVIPEAARPGWDYVLIGRHEATAQRPFPDLMADLASGLAKLHAREDSGEPEKQRPPRRKGRK